jgi:hypothetical protein
VEVNWEDWTAKIYFDLMKYAECSPMKLTPPAFKEQIQALINILGDYAYDNPRLADAESVKVRGCQGHTITQCYVYMSRTHKNTILHI